MACPPACASGPTDRPAALARGDMMQLVGCGMSREAARSVYAQASIGLEDLDMVELHDCFAHNGRIVVQGTSPGRDRTRPMLRTVAAAARHGGRASGEGRAPGTGPQAGVGRSLRRHVVRGGRESLNVRRRLCGCTSHPSSNGDSPGCYSMRDMMRLPAISCLINAKRWRLTQPASTAVATPCNCLKNPSATGLSIS